MPDMDKAIKDLEEVREYIARKGHDLASRKCRMMDKVTDAIAMLKEETVVRCADCRWFTDGICDKYGFAHPHDYFCDDGERRATDE